MRERDERVERLPWVVRQDEEGDSYVWTDRDPLTGFAHSIELHLHDNRETLRRASAIAAALNAVAARSQGAVPSPDGPDAEHQHLRDAMARIARALGHTVPLVLEVTCQEGESPAQRIAREVEELASRGSPDGGDLPALRAMAAHVWGMITTAHRIGAAPPPDEDWPLWRDEMRKLAALARGVGPLPAPREESEAIERAIRLMEAEWEVYVVRGDKGVSFTAADRYAIRDRVRASVGASRSGGGPALEGTGQ